MEPLREIVDADISFISLVKAGANQKVVIWKSAKQPGELTLQKEIKILKTDEEKQMVYGIVYSPGEVDTDGDFASAEAIEKMAYNFMKNARTTNVDQQHDFVADEGFVAESWITKSGDPLFADQPVGSWAVGIKVENQETWGLVKSGEIQGLSMAGAAQTVPVQKKNGGVMKNAFETIVKFFKEKIQKDFNSDYAKEQLWALYYALTDSVWKVLDNLQYGTITKDEAKEQLFIQVSQFMEKLKAVDVTKEMKPIITPEVLEKIDTLSQALQALTEGANIKKSQEADMEKQDVQKMIDEAMKPVNDSLEELKKSLKTTEEKSKPETIPAQKSDEPTLKDVLDRIEKLEKTTPGSKLAKEDGDIKKSETKGIQFVPSDDQ